MPAPSIRASYERALPPGDAIWLRGAEAFLWCPGGFSLLDHAAVIEKRLGVAVTHAHVDTVTSLAQRLAF